MAELLGGPDFGFEVELLLGSAASRAGILAGYQAIIERAEPGDAVVIYFSGHGGLAIAPDLSSGALALPGQLRFIAPTDFAQTTEDDFRGISAWELSQLLRQLTD